MKTTLSIALAAAFCLLAGWIIGREVTVTLLYTSDIHGHLTGVTSDRKAKPDGGLLRCATLIGDIRKREPNVLLIDGGDLIQGTAVGFLNRGDVMIDAVSTLRYDALVVGNHEFDWGTANLVRLYARTEIPILAANIASSGTQPRDRFPWRPFLVRDVDGARVVIIGLANPMTASWIRPRLLDGLRFDSSVAALRRVLPAVREQNPDVLVVAVHQGYRKWGDNAANEINAITRSFPEIDVLLGGHIHQPVEGMELRGIAYIQPEAYGLWLGKVSLRVDTNQHRVISRVAELIPVDSRIKPDPVLKQQCAGELNRSQAYLDRKIGRAAGNLRSKSRFPGQSQVQRLIARAIAEAVKADVVFHGTLSSASLTAGRITMRDLWRIVPYENTIGVAHLTAEELREILEENSRYLKSKQFRGVEGVTYDIAGRKSPGSRFYNIRNIRLADGRVLKEGERIRVAFNSYDLASAGARFPRLREIADRPSSRLEETDVDTREAVSAYIRKHQPLEEKAVAGARIVRKSK